MLKNNTKKKLNILTKTILIGGAAGEGIKSSGHLLSKLLIKNGYNVFLYDEYPSLIKGGHNSVRITYSIYPVYSTTKLIDILICLDDKTFEEHKHELNEGAIIIVDPKIVKPNIDDLTNISCEILEVEVSQILRLHKIHKLMKNLCFISFFCNLIGIEQQKLVEECKLVFDNTKNIDPNLTAIDLIYRYTSDCSNLYKSKFFSDSQSSYITNNLFLSGNELAGIGGVEGGIKFYAGYPMTPSSTILDFFIKWQKEYQIIVKQTEDEIAAINMAIGASFAGARSMVATSGGGFSLMVEGLGLAAITETPLVIIVSQRPGPATGLPTWTAQGDLQFVLHASQDEFPRVVFAPTSHDEARKITQIALNIADNYQVPVIVLLDKYLSESFINYEWKDTTIRNSRTSLLTEEKLERIPEYKRYEIASNGVSMRSIPGQKNGIHLASGDESDEYGYPNETALNRKNKVEKRWKKVEFIKNEIPEINVYGSPNAEIVFITWGSTTGSILEIIRRLNNRNIKLIALNTLFPLPSDDIKEAIGRYEKIFCVENNFTGQLAQILEYELDLEFTGKLLKYDGRPIFPEDVIEFLNEQNLI